MGMGNSSLKVDGADKGYTGGQKERENGAAKSQTYQGAATKSSNPVASHIPGTSLHQKLAAGQRQ